MFPEEDAVQVDLCDVPELRNGSLVHCSMVAVSSVLSSATSNDCFVKFLTCFSSTYAVLPVHSSMSCPSLGEGVGDGHVTVT